MQKTSQKDNARQILEAYLRQRRMRQTPERFAILDMAMTMTGHFGVEELYAAMEAEAYHVSRTTVYNTVELLCRCGLLQKQHIESRGAVFEVAQSSHAHLVCMQCGKVRELLDPAFADSIAAARIGNFAVSYVAATVYGLCSTCVRRNRRGKK